MYILSLVLLFLALFCGLAAFVLSVMEEDFEPWGMRAAWAASVLVPASSLAYWANG